MLSGVVEVTFWGSGAVSSILLFGRFEFPLSHSENKGTRSARNVGNYFPADTISQ